MAKLLDRPFTREEKRDILDMLQGKHKQDICLE